LCGANEINNVLPLGQDTREQPFDFLSITFVCLMVFNATFNNISALSWWSVLLVEESHQPVASHLHTLSHNIVHLSLIEIRTHNISGDTMLPVSLDCQFCIALSIL
jgi:hypothetical protein